MTTQTATPAPADTALTAAARAQRVFAVIADGYDTQRRIMERTAIAKTTLLDTLKFLADQGRIERVQDGRNVFYRITEPTPAPRERIPNPDGPVARREPSGMDRLTGAPDPRVAAAIAAKAGAIAPAQRTEGSAPGIGSGTAARLRKGQAEEMLLAFLAQHDTPDGYGPYELGRAIAPQGHKPMGVRDLCARLAKAGTLEVVQDKPVRYRLAVRPTAE